MLLHACHTLYILSSLTYEERYNRNVGVREEIADGEYSIPVKTNNFLRPDMTYNSILYIHLAYHHIIDESPDPNSCLYP